MELVTTFQGFSVPFCCLREVSFRGRRADTFGVQGRFKIDHIGVVQSFLLQSHFVPILWANYRNVEDSECHNEGNVSQRGAAERYQTRLKIRLRNTNDIGLCVLDQ